MSNAALPVAVPGRAGVSNAARPVVVPASSGRAALLMPDGRNNNVAPPDAGPAGRPAGRPGHVAAPVQRVIRQHQERAGGVSGFLRERCRMKEGCRRIVRSTLLGAETFLQEPENPPARAASPRKSPTQVPLVALLHRQCPVDGPGDAGAAARKTCVLTGPRATSWAGRSPSRGGNRASASVR